METRGAPKVLRPSFCCDASRYRAAIKGLSGFLEQHYGLKSLAWDGLPVAQALPGNLSPVGWLGQAYCTYLTKALQCNAGDGDSSVQNDSLKLRGAYLKGTLRSGLQAKVCGLMREHMR